MAGYRDWRIEFLPAIERWRITYTKSLDKPIILTLDAEQMRGLYGALIVNAED